MARQGDPEAYPGGAGGFPQYGSVAHGREPLEPSDLLAQDLNHAAGFASDQATAAVDNFGQHVSRAYNRPDVYVDKAADGLHAVGNAILRLTAPYSQPKPTLQPRRRRMSMLPFVICYILPCTFFAIVFFVVSSSFRHAQPLLCFAIVGCSLFLVLIAFCASPMAKRGKAQNEPSLLTFLFLTLLLAWVLAVAGGETNYLMTIHKFAAMQSLSTYHSVDPASMQGQQLMDAGIVQFSNNSRLDVAKSMHFRNAEIYCVAPVTSADVPLVQYDFWIVGKGCCTSRSGSFRCGGYSGGRFGDPRVTTGLRLTNDAERSYYRLAVQQAEAKFGIKAGHPLFFTAETRDPDAAAAKAKQDNRRWFMIGLLAFCMYHAFQTYVAAVAYSRSI